MGVDADDVLDFLDHPFRIRGRQVDLVEHRHHFHPLLDGGVAVGHGLGFHTLRRIHHQQRALAGRQRAGDFVGEVPVARGVDQVELIGLAIPGVVGERRGLGLDGDAPLPLEVHGIEHLLGHLPFRQPAAMLDETVRERGLAVVDVGDDGKVTDVLHGNACRIVLRAGRPAGWGWSCRLVIGLPRRASASRPVSPTRSPPPALQGTDPGQKKGTQVPFSCRPAILAERARELMHFRHRIGRAAGRAVQRNRARSGR